MDTQTIQEAVMIAVGLALFVAFVTWFVRFSRAMDALWPNAATKFGLRFELREQKNLLTGRRSERSLEGTVLGSGGRGVPLRVISSFLLVGRRRRTSTVFQARAVERANLSFQVSLTRGARPKATYHVMQTGDAAFDAVFLLQTDAPDGARALLAPAVRKALLQLPNSLVTNEMSVAYDQGELTLSYGRQPSTAVELEAPLEALIAMAEARIA